MNKISPRVGMSQENCWQFLSWSHAFWLVKIPFLAFCLFVLGFFVVSVNWNMLSWLQQLCLADKRWCWTKPLIWALASAPHVCHSWLLSWLKLTPWWPGPKVLPFDDLQVSAWAFRGLTKTIDWYPQGKCKICVYSYFTIQDRENCLFEDAPGKNCCHLCPLVPKSK